MNRLAAVAVWWDDSHNTGSNLDANEIERSHRPMPLISVGLLVRDDESGVSIVRSVCPMAKEMDAYEYRVREFIPRPMIRRMRRLGWVELAQVTEAT